MNQGIIPPRRIVVKKTINNIVLLMIYTAIYYSGVACSGAYTVNIRAKATDPLIVPAVDTITI